MAVISWVITLFIYLYLHEFAGHYLTNLICGIHVNQMIINWDPFLPIIPKGVSIIDVNVPPPRISYFAGGAVAALILLSSSLIFYVIYKRTTDERFFVLFSVGLGFVCMGLIDSITEPFFPMFHGTLIDGIMILVVAIMVPIVILKIHNRKRNSELL